MSKKIYLAQQQALTENNTLVIYEGFRPNSLQKMIVNTVTSLANTDSEVIKGINTPPWSTNWFIATTTSNHQMGYGIDVSLAKVNEIDERIIGPYSTKKVTLYDEYIMPTPVYELSMASATFTGPVNALSKTVWQNVILIDTMNDSSITLQRYCTMAGLTPLASEWWHFNVIDAMNEIVSYSSDGDYLLSDINSEIPPSENSN